MINIGSTLPPSATTPLSKKKITPSSQSGEGNLAVTETGEDSPKVPVSDRRKRRDRRKQKKDTLMDMRCGRGRRQSDKSSGSIDVSV